MTKKRVELVKEWFDKGNNDLTSAKIVFEQGYCVDTIAVLIQQAVEKYVKGYLIYNGWHLIKTHNIERLLNEAIKFDKSFSEYLEFGRQISRYYAEDRYPEGPSKYPKEELADAFKTAGGLIKKLKSAVKELKILW